MNKLRLILLSGALFGFSVPAHAITQNIVDHATTTVQPNVSLSVSLGRIDNLIMGASSTVNAMLPFNVKNYGAVGNCIADDSAAFNRTIAAATTTAGGILAGYFGAEIYAPQGCYKIDNIIISTGNSTNGASGNVSVRGETGSTYFMGTSTTNFILSYLGSNNANKRYIKDIIFLGPRSLYFNYANFMNVSDCQFRSGEYGIYSNASEFNHFYNCFFINNSSAGYFATTLNNDITGRNPIVSQNSAAAWFSQCHWWLNKVGFYGDDPDNVPGDHQAAWSFHQCEFLTNTIGFATVMVPGSQRFYQAQFNYTWFEGNVVPSTGGVILNGNVLAPGGYADIYVKNAEINVDNVTLAGSTYLLGAKFKGTNFNVTDASFEVDEHTTANIDNVLGDKQGGVILDWAYATNFQNFNPDRPALAMTQDRVGFTNNNSYRNVLATTTTNSCAFGNLPTASSGTPSISYFYGDGFINNTSVKIVGVPGESVRWSAVVSSANWYVTTFGIRGSTNSVNYSSFTIQSASPLIVPAGQGRTIDLSNNWRTYASIGQPSIGGTANIDFTLVDGTTIYLSAIQVVQFTTLQDAKNFFNSSTYVLNPDEVYNGTVVSSYTVAKNTPASATIGDLVSMTVPAGDWDINCEIDFQQSGSTWTAVLAGISTTAGASATGLIGADTRNDASWASYTGSDQVPMYVLPRRVHLTQPTIYYLKYRATYSLGQPVARGGLWAVRANGNP